MEVSELLQWGKYGGWGVILIETFWSDEIIEWGIYGDERFIEEKRRKYGSGILEEDTLWIWRYYKYGKIMELEELMMWRNYEGGEIMDAVELWSWWII